MKSYVSIREAVPQLTNAFKWFDSFIREMYFTSERCLSEIKTPAGGTTIGGAGHALNLRMVVAAAGNPSIFGIEFLCLSVEAFSLQRLVELSFDCTLERDSVRLDFCSAASDGGSCWVIAKEVQVVFLGKEYLGPLLRLGHEAPREDATNAAKIDECWRQCGNCSNAWIEKSEIEFARCPECGLLTRLVENLTRCGVVPLDSPGSIGSQGNP